MLKLTSNVNLSNFTLIIPSVSVGNVPQLAADLLISSFDFKKVGLFWHPAIIPSVGNDPFQVADAKVCTAGEMYAHDGFKLAVFQLRSGLDPKLAKKFLNDLKSCIIKYSFGDIIIVSSAFDYELHLVDKEKHFYSSTRGVDENLEKVNFKNKPFNNDSQAFNIPGGGYAAYLYEILRDEPSALSGHCTVLIKYVSEGDNRPEAISIVLSLVKYLENFKSVKNIEIKYPISWSQLFGGPPPSGLY